MSCWEEERRKSKVNWNLQGNYCPADKVPGAFPIPISKWTAFPSTGVQAGGPVESKRLWKNYNGSTMFISRLCFNHNPLSRYDLPEEVAHRASLAALTLEAVRSRSSTLPLLRRDQLTTGLRRPKLALKNIFSPGYSCSWFWMKWILVIWPRCPGSSHCKRKILKFHSVFY